MSRGYKLVLRMNYHFSFGRVDSLRCGQFPVMNRVTTKKPVKMPKMTTSVNTIHANGCLKIEFARLCVFIAILFPTRTEIVL
jgi:hypothetical protein